MSRKMINAYADKNGKILANAGLSTDWGNLYLAHFADGPVAVKILKADPSTPIEQLMSPAAIEANPFLKGKDARWVISWAKRKVNS